MSPPQTDQPPIPRLPALRPCWVEVNLAALRHNLQYLRARLSPETHILAVVKADGYGHGAVAVAQAALQAGVRWLGVSSLEEGAVLRRAGITAAILILGSLYPYEVLPRLLDDGLTPTVASLAMAEALSRLAQGRTRPIPLHVKIDSGFGRIGLTISHALSTLRRIWALPGLTVEGLYTHFAAADSDPAYTREQFTAFRHVVEAFRTLGWTGRWVHAANSAAIFQYPESHGTLVRPGLAMYGVPPLVGHTPAMPLEPVLTWKARVVFVKQLPAGSSISYGRTFTTTRLVRVATIPVGYADGYPRQLSNLGQVLIQGFRAPVVGRVTMDMTMVDVTDLPRCEVGEEVVLIGRQGQDHMTAEEVAARAGTISYDLLCGIAHRVPRLVTGDQGIS